MHFDQDWDHIALCIKNSRMEDLPVTTLLHNAASSKKPHKVVKLLNSGADINGKIRGGYTPLNTAVRHRRLSCFNVLLDRGADVNIADCYGKIPLHYAAQHGELPMVRRLLRAESMIDAQDENNYTSLHIAIENKRIECVEELLNAGAAVNIQDCQGRYAMHVAIKQGCVSVVGRLLTLNGDITVHGLDKRAALKMYVEMGNPDWHNILLKAGIDFDLVDEVELSSLQDAAINGRTLTWKNVMARKPKALAGKLGQLKLLETVLYNNRLDYFCDLIDAGCDVHLKDEHNRTLLHVAAQCRSELPLLVLLELDLHVDVQDNDGNTPLHLACSRQRINNILLLLDAGARWDIQNNYKRTMLWNLLQSLKLYHLTNAEMPLFREILEQTNHGQVIDPSTNYTAVHYIMDPLFLQHSNFSVDLAMLVVSTQKSLGGVDSEGHSVIHHITRSLAYIGMNAMPLIQICIERGSYLDSQDCDMIKTDPDMLDSLFRDEHFCVQNIANQFNNYTLVKLNEHLKEAWTDPNQTLRITPMKGSWKITEQDVRLEIKKKGYCDVSRLRTTSLSKQCLESFLKCLKV